MIAPLVPVTLAIGHWTFAMGSLPEIDDDLAKVLGPTIEDLERILADRVERAARILREEIEAADILAAHRAAVTFAIRRTPRARNHDPVGPMTRYLRERAGVTRIALARAMGRSRGAVASWEAGRRSRFHLGDDRRASEALGYSPGTLLSVYFQVVEPRRTGRPA